MRAIGVYCRVVWALMLRESLTRYGRIKFGYLWAFIEPAIYVAAFVAFRTFISSQLPFGDNAIVFLLTAVLTFRTAMGLTRRTLGAVHANMALLTFPQVKTFDVITARIILEAATWTLTGAIFLFGLYFFGGVWAAQRLDILLEGYLATLLLGGSFGFFNATFVSLVPFWEKLLGLVSLPLFFISGLFFLPSAMPPDLLAYLWWNPFLHVVEWVRAGVYIDYQPFLSKEYVITLSAVLLFSGLFINRFFQAEMMRE